MRRVTIVDMIPFLALIGFFLLGLYGSEQGGGGEFYLLVAGVAGAGLVLGWLGLHFRDQALDIWGDMQALRVRRARARLPEPETLEIAAALTALQRRDYRTAAAILWLASEQGDGQAQYILSNLFRRGRGVPKSREEALKWLVRAARHGVVDAQADLGAAYLEQSRERNVMEGIKWLETAAQQGNHNAQVRLGDVYSDGFDVQRDLDRAARWYRSAAEKGHSQAQRSLGRLYLHGRGVPKDPVQAFAWLRLAAEQGDSLARRDLSRAGARLTAADRGNSDWLVHEWQGKLSEGQRRAAKQKRKAEQKRLDRERGRVIALSVVDQIRDALAAVGAEPQETPSVEGVPEGATGKAADPAKSAQAALSGTAAGQAVARKTETGDKPAEPSEEQSPRSRMLRRAARKAGSEEEKSEVDVDKALAARAAEELDEARSRSDRTRKRAGEEAGSARPEKRRETLRERVGRLSGGDRPNVPTTPQPVEPPARAAPGSREDEVVLSDAANRANAANPADAAAGTGESETPSRQRLNSMARRGSALANRLGREGGLGDGDAGAAEAADDRGRRGGGRLSRRDRSALVAERLANLPQAKQEAEEKN